MDQDASSPPQLVRLVIADRRPTSASGLAAALERTVDLVVSYTCHESRELATVLRPGSGIAAVVVDSEMFEGDALRVVEAVRLLEPDVAVLVLTTRVDDRLLKSLAYRRVSCVSAYSEAESIVAALRALLSGATLLPVEVQRAFTEMLRKTERPLTAREEQVLELAATGLTIAQIAATLHISHSTAKTHLLRVYEKLDAPNRSAAVATAAVRGLLHASNSTAA